VTVHSAVGGETVAAAAKSARFTTVEPIPADEATLAVSVTVPFPPGPTVPRFHVSVRLETSYERLIPPEAETNERPLGSLSTIFAEDAAFAPVFW
jgi:hypothetical protein